MKKCGADECDAALALTFSLTTLFRSEYFFASSVLFLIIFFNFQRAVEKPRSTQPPVAPAASRLQYGRRRNA